MNAAFSVWLYEDDAVDQLRPVVTARPAYAISCASFRLIDWVAPLSQSIVADVRPHLLEIQRLDFKLPATLPTDPFQTPVLLVNARMVPTPGVAAGLRALIANRRDQVIRNSRGELCAAWISNPATTTTTGDLVALAGQIEVTAPSATPLELFGWPHDIVAHHMRGMNASMEYRLAHGDYEQLQDGVFVRPGVRIGQYAVIDTSDGPIILEEDVQVGPFCYLSGPVHAGPRTRVIEHAALKDGVALGHTTKIGGEVEASVIEPYTNKQHHGFLGHSYLGSWINLGAGTCNSDLKNTYGHINMEYRNEKVATEMQFMGCVIGDYSKSAINTGIFTGKIVGVSSMLYGFVTTNVASFVTYARLFGQTSVLPAEVMISTQARMFARRKVEQRECDRQLIRDMFELTEDERGETQLGL